MKHPLSTNLTLDLPGESSLEFEVALPDGRVTPLDLVPIIHRMADALHERTLSHHAVTCAQGCTHCCHQLVPVSEPEALHLARVVRAMDNASRRPIVARFTKTMRSLDSVGLLSPLTDTIGRPTPDQATMLGLRKRYWRLQLPCPFLEDDLCAVHAHRPLACRSYFVTSSPERCAAIYEAAPGPVPVRHGADVGGALAAFSGHGIQQTRIVPLPLVLMAERPLSARPMPTLPGPVMLDRFLTLLADYYARPDATTPR